MNLSVYDRPDVTEYLGKQIVGVTVTESINIAFADGSLLTLEDAADSCNGDRYLDCDDDLSEMAGQTLMSIGDKGIEYGPSNDHEETEYCFVEIQGSKSSVTVTAYNEHNGNYGGFRFIVRSPP